MPESPVILLGLGFTATRLARRLLADGRSVFAATRNAERFSALFDQGLRISGFNASAFPVGAVVAHTIPPVDEPAQTLLHNFLLAIAPRRVVYVSATSVYGDLSVVDAESPAIPAGEPAVRRFQEEQWIAGGPWESLILRAAAIYGPGRGAHRRLASRQEPALNQRRGPSALVSRIHVDDLSRLVALGLDSALCGAFPVADQEPCSTEALLHWCVQYLELDPADVDIGGTISTGRRVDGSFIINKLGAILTYPDYRSGVAHCIHEEGWPKNGQAAAADGT